MDYGTQKKKKYLWLSLLLDGEWAMGNFIDVAYP